MVLYELLTGELPFRGNQRMLLHQVIHDEPGAPRSLNDRIPRDLETICLKAMAKEPAGRYATAGELAADLKRWLRGEPIHARPGAVGATVAPVPAQPLGGHIVALLAASMLASAVGVILDGLCGLQQRDIEAKRFKEGRGIRLEYAFQSRLDIRWLRRRARRRRQFEIWKTFLYTSKCSQFRSCGR